MSIMSYAYPISVSLLKSLRVTIASITIAMTITCTLIMKMPILNNRSYVHHYCCYHYDRYLVIIIRIMISIVVITTILVIFTIVIVIITIAMALVFALPTVFSLHYRCHCYCCKTSLLYLSLHHPLAVCSATLSASGPSESNR